jgi:hypothetical protein
VHQGIPAGNQRGVKPAWPHVPVLTGADSEPWVETSGLGFPPCACLSLVALIQVFPAPWLGGVTIGFPAETEFLQMSFV